VLACDAPIVELNLCVEEADGLAPLRRKIEELEAILENDDASEPVKTEVRRELEEIYAYQNATPSRPSRRPKRPYVRCAARSPASTNTLPLLLTRTVNQIASFNHLQPTSNDTSSFPPTQSPDP